MPRNLRLHALALFGLALSAPGQVVAPDPAARQEGEALARALTGDAHADEILLRSLDVDRAVRLLQALVERSSSVEATEADVASGHRALTGLVELYEFRQEWWLAALQAETQGQAYQNDGYPAQALEWSRRALDLIQRSGRMEWLSRAWGSVSKDLTSLDRLDEAASAAHEARIRLAPAEAFSYFGANAWNLELSAELNRGNRAGAREVLRELQQAAESRSATPLFKSCAILSQMELLLAENKFVEVPGVVEKALQVAVPAGERWQITTWAAIRLMVVTDAMRYRVPFSEAQAIAAQLDRIGGLWPMVAASGHQALRWRRMLAGDLQGALREGSAELEKARSSGGVADQVDALRWLASDYEAANSTSNQVAMLEQAWDLAKTMPGGALWNPPLLLELGHAYLAAKRFPDALRTYDSLLARIDSEESVQRKRQAAGARVECRLGAAEARRLSGDALQARTIAEGVLRELLSNQQRHYEWEAQAYLILARLHREVSAEKEYQLAIDAMAKYEARQLLAQWRTGWSPGAHSQDTVLSLELETARFLADKGHWAAARAHLQAAADRMKGQSLAASAWQLAFFSGMVWEGENQPAKALASYQEAMNGLEGIRSGLNGTEQRQTFNDNELIAELYARVVALLARTGQADLAWQYTERGKARAFVEALHAKRLNPYPQPPATATYEDAMKQIDLLSLESDIADARRGKPAEKGDLSRDAAGTSKAEIRGLEREFSTLRQEVAIRSASGTAVAKWKAPSIRELQARLSPVAAVVEFAILPDALTAFVITRTSFEQLKWSTHGAALEKQIVALRSSLGDDQSVDKVAPLVAQVSAMVWGPVAAKLPAGVDRLMIVPAGYLNYVPFQVFTMPDGRSLIDRYTISYLPSAATLLLLAPRHKSSDLFLGALGGVSVEDSVPLPATLNEVAGIAKLYPEAEIEKESGFTHDIALRALDKHDVVHFATHGIFEPSAPLFSALLVSPAQGQSGRLAMYELSDHPIRARLVVLSACKTGVGKLFRGDEVAGLTRSFLSAGATTVVSSLWQVGDESTALLMQEFYRGLRAGSFPAEALRAASLAVRKKYPDPLYWAPFIVTGAE